jgi:hypothetical protein
MRPTVSMGPPAANGITIVKDRFGHSAARTWATSGIVIKASAARVAQSARSISIFVLSARVGSFIIRASLSSLDSNACVMSDDLVS